MPSAIRSSIDNAIWCCQACAKHIDDDPAHFTSDLLRAWKKNAEDEAFSNLEKPIVGMLPELDSEQIAAQNDILLGSLEGHEGNMIVFGERNGWDVVSVIGEHYNSTQLERSLYVDAMIQLIDAGLVQRRGGVAYLLTYQGLKKAENLKKLGLVRRKPTEVVKS